MADRREFAMPDLGEGLTDGELVEWQVEIGDHVELNQTLCVVETAKAAVEIPSPFAGVVVDRIGDIGDVIDVGTVIVRLDVMGESRESVDAPELSAQAADANPEPLLVGYGTTQTASRRHRVASRLAEPAGRGRALAKPPVRKLAKTLGVDLSSLAPGSGPRGSVTREDVMGAANGPRGADDAATPNQGFRGLRPGDTIPYRGVRRTIGERMAMSRSTIPDATCSQWADCTRLWELRDRLRTESSVNLTPFSIMLWLAAHALTRFPTLNATLDEAAGHIHLHPHIHLGVATDTPRGLVVVVIRDAQTLSPLAMAAELHGLAERARAGSIGPDDLTGSTFTVSNYGAFGNDDGIPIINPPEAAILGIGAMKVRPWVDGDAVVARRTVKLSCVFDHRVCDGAEAGGFLNYLAQCVEEPALPSFRPPS